MPADNDQSQVQSLIGPELQSLPLQTIITAAMNGIVTAQTLSSQSTADFISNVKGSVTFDAAINDADPTKPSKKVTVTVPTLAVVPVPSIRCDSATIHFNFEIKEVLTSSKETTASANLNVEAKGLLKAILNASLSGSVAHKSSTENTLNRSGMLDITIHLSEPPMPEGLAKVLSILANSIEITPKQ